MPDALVTTARAPRVPHAKAPDPETATIAAAAAAVTAAGVGAAATIAAAADAAAAAAKTASDAAASAVAAAAASAAAAVDVAAVHAASVGLSLRDMVLDHDHKLDAMPPGQKMQELLTWRAELGGAFALMKLAFGVSILSAIISILAVIQILSNPG
jgi:hypothetical protein